MTLKKLTAIVLTGALLLLTACSDSDSGSGKKARRKTTTPLAKLGQLMGSGRLPSWKSRKRLSATSIRRKKPAAVYIVDYEYTNIGYEDGIAKGIFLDMEDTIID